MDALIFYTLILFLHVKYSEYPMYEAVNMKKPPLSCR